MTNPTPTDWRALCARMADELDHYRQLLMDDRRATHALATEARAALEAQPEPLTDKGVAELVAALKNDAECVEVEHYDLCSMTAEQMRRAADLLERLAQPEPQGLTDEEPTDQEIEEWADAAAEVPLEEMDPEVHGWRRCFKSDEFSETIRAALARWGTPATTGEQQ